MSIFSKPLSQLDAVDLQELLTDRAVENARLEFKVQVPTKDDTLKKLSSFANTFGGYMVIGARANSATAASKGCQAWTKRMGTNRRLWIGASTERARL